MNAGSTPAERCPVLIVEDELVTRIVVERRIRARGHPVAVEESAEAALALLEHTFYPLILLDVQLPGIDGLEFCRRIRKRRGGDLIYILVGTSGSGVDQLEEILDAGADDYIAKPYDFGLLAVRLTIAERRVKQLAVQKQLEERLVYLARHDPLTGLENRGMMEEHLAVTIAGGQHAALLYIDLDNFKVVNDTLGHAAGDRLLVQVAQLFRRATRATDQIARFGGDEFVILLPSADRSDALHVAERIRKEIENFVFAESGRAFRIGTSIGLASADGFSDAAALLAAADAACYAAKAGGRNRVMAYRSDLDEIARLVADTNWVSQIRSAIASETLPLWFQPVVRLSDGTIAFHEVLVRFVDAEIAVSPAAFLPALERSGEIRMLDYYMVRKAIERLSQDPGLRLSVNLSGVTVADAETMGALEKCIREAKLPAGALILEITESSLIRELDRAKSQMQELASCGVLFALDDFGAGFSSFRYLKDLPVQILKIEGSFIRAMLEEDSNQLLVRAICEMALALGLQIVAEWVETEEAAQRLKSFGVHYGQGYWFGAPKTEPVRDTASSG